MSNIKDLWPEMELKALPTPVTILKQQAVYLGQKTKNIVTAKIQSNIDESDSLSLKGINNSKIQHRFLLVAPVLNNYTYQLFYITHEIENPYPLTIFLEDEKISVKSEDEFIKNLEIIFSSTNTIKIIQTLISQSK